MSMKNSLTPAVFEPATFRFVAQHLNPCATAVAFASAYAFFKLTNAEATFNKTFNKFHAIVQGC